MFKFDQVRATFRITRCVILFITLWNIHTCECRHIYSVKGQNTLLNFPFPCNSTEVTLQYTYGLPFYRSTDGFVLSLPQNQANRFKVKKNIEHGNCSLDLTISSLKAIDQGTYLSTIYMDKQLLDDLTTRIWLKVDYPPDMASCVKEEDTGGDWVSIVCTANNGDLAGEIECYQNGQTMPPVNGRVENYSSLTESFLIRKSQPVFCCSSTLNEYKDRCKCNDAALNIADGDSNDPCPPASTITTISSVSIFKEKNQTDSTGMSSTPMNMKQRTNNYVIIISVLVPLAVLLIVLGLFVWYRKKVKTTTYQEVKDAMQVCEDVEAEGTTFSLAKNQHYPSNKAT